jgi:hypothetical protein
MWWVLSLASKDPHEQQEEDQHCQSVLQRPTQANHASKKHLSDASL